MTNPEEIGAEAFGKARAGERARAAKQSLIGRREALVALHAARDAFAEPGQASPEDADLVEDLAGRIQAFVLGLEPLLDALQGARDQTLYRGPVLTRLRSRLDVDRLAVLLGDAIAEELLSGPAACLLAAALRYEAA